MGALCPPYFLMKDSKKEKYKTGQKEKIKFGIQYKVFCCVK